MDNLDVKIIGEMLRANTSPPSVRRSFRIIARRLVVDENTIRNRIEKLRKSEFLKGWLIGINPNLLGEKVVRLWFDVQPQSGKPSAIKKISLIQGVGLILNYFGASLSVTLYYEEKEALKKTTELIQRISDSDNMRWANVPFPPCALKLARKDWMIIKSLQKNPWKPFADIAKELDLSSITVKRRLTRMNDGATLHLLVDIDPKAVEGSLLAHLVVFYEKADARHVINERISEYLGDKIAFTDLDDTEHGFFALMIKSISKVEETLRWVKEQSGVKSARLDILQDMLTFPSVHESHVQKGLRIAGK